MILLVIGAIFMLAVSVIVHELGHLLMGKLVGVNARIFSIGYGKGIWKKRIGKTIYQITAIPFGGYVQFKGDNYLKKRKGSPDELLSIHPLKRIIPVIGGPLFNLILGFIIFFFLGLSDESLPGNKISIDSGMQDYSQGYKSGLRSNDIITAINGKKIETFEEIFAIVSLSKGETLNINYNRDGKEFIAKVNPDVTGSRPEIGISPAGEKRVVVTFGYMEQLRRWASGLLGENKESEKYFSEKFKDVEIPDLQKQQLDLKKNNLTSRVLDYLNDGDIILDIENTPVYSISDLQQELGKYQHKKVAIKVERKLYPLITPWSKEIVVTHVPVRSANIITFTNLTDSVSGYDTDNFSIVDYDPEIEIKLANLVINGERFKKFDLLLNFLENLTHKEIQNIKLSVGNINYEAGFQIKPIGLLGFRPSLKFSPETSKRNISIAGAFAYSVESISQNIGNSFKAISMLLGGWLSPSQGLSGPVGIFEAAGLSLEYGWYTYFDFVGKISIALMFMNLLPLPLVDGGHILLYIIEAIAGRPIPPKIMEIIFKAGFFFLIGLAIFVTYFDIMRIVK